MQLQDLLHMSSFAGGPELIRTRQIGKKLTLGERIDYKPLLKDVKEVLKELHIVIQADLETSRIFMEQVRATNILCRNDFQQFFSHNPFCFVTYSISGERYEYDQ